MKNKKIIIISHFFIIFTLLNFNKTYSQDEKAKNVEYTIIAEGTDSPIPDTQVLCFNKYFNKDYLPTKFLKKHSLDKKDLYKKKC